MTSPNTTDPTRGLAMLSTALGPSIAAMLEAPDTIEVIANPDGRLWLEQVGKGRVPTPHRLEAAETERVIRLVATLTGAEANRDRPIVSAELPPRGERFEGVLPPVARGPCFAIRKPASRVFTLDEYVALGIASPEQGEELRRAVRTRANIIVAGGTGSGKTTLANALLHEIARLGERVVILEDTREMPEKMQTMEAPPLFVIGESGPELTNYRIAGRYYVVDRLFNQAELRLGTGWGAKKVQIHRQTPISGGPRG